VSSPMINIILKNDKTAREQYSKIIGREAVDFLANAKSLGSQFGITMETRPSNQEKMDIHRIADASFQKYTQGMAGVNEGQRMWVYQQLNNGSNIKEVIYRIQYWIRIDEQRRQQEKEKMIQMQNQGLEKIEVTKAKATKEQSTMDSQFKNKEISTQAQADILVREHDSKKKIEEILAQQKGQAARELALQGNEKTANK